MIELCALERISTQCAEDLLDRAFGVDRRQRTAYRLREGVSALPDISFGASDDGVLIGLIQCWPVVFRGDDGTNLDMTLLGPVAVEPERQRDGIGRYLMRASMAAMAQRGLDDAMMLIGDPEYYGRFFAFSADRTTGWRLPGPVEPHRLLARGCAVPCGEGVVAARPNIATELAA